MDNTILVLSARGLALVPVTVALVSVAKYYLGEKWGPYFSPLLSLGFGGILVAIVGGVTVLDSQILGGLIVGLTASGLYSGVKTLAGY